LTYLNLYSEDTQLDFGPEFEAHLSRMREQSFEPSPHLIGADRVEDGPLIEREDPSRADAVISSCHDAPAAVVEKAIEAAAAAQPAWAALTGEERAAALRPVAEAVDAKQVELAALVSLETGKSRGEAIGEVIEVSELVNVYCGIAEDRERFQEPLEDADDGIQRRSFLRPYGVFGVVAPFNFPMALTSNMSLGALLAGNAVVVKPSELTPRSANAIAEIFIDHLPPGVFNIVHGGDETGRALIDGDIDGAAFTGSARVGLEIVRKLQTGPYPRPVIAEMGGKNPAVVAPSADLEVAAAAVAKSAFGLSGQKCSCCSRVLVHKDVEQKFVELLAAQLERIAVGDPVEAGNFAGPVIESGVVDRYRKAVGEAESVGEVHRGPAPTSDEGYYVPATVAVVPGGHDLAREEMFMPFLTVSAFDSIDEAIDEANAVPYGLTAGIFSKDEDEVSRFLNDVEAGCVFANHAGGATTGVWPRYGTFGGWKSSGSTGKHGFGIFFIQQFAREQLQTVAPTTP
jgi:1-pyrroline-5-carboxylate dehydrogenase